MPTTPPNFIWRKQVSADWLREREAQLAAHTGGTHAVIERPGRRRLVIERFCENQRQACELADLFGGAIVRLPADWEATALAGHQTTPLRIGRRLIVRSDPAPDSTTPALVIPAGAAFGTGEHATTAMSLRLLEAITRKLAPGWKMLDAGTGSGILALAGRRFGAGVVLAVDNDPNAIRTARANARANRIRGVKFVTGGIAQHLRGSFDIITANLYSELLASVLPGFHRALRREGHLIASGVLRAQEPALRKALKANGFRIDQTRRRGKWVALLCGGDA